MTLTAIFLNLATLIMSYMPVSSYVEGVVDQPKSFLPNETRSQHEASVSSLVFRGLFKYDIYGTLVPDLAETWEISEDGLTYKITIKDGNYWSNGKKITSDDIIYTAFKMPALEGVATDKVDDKTVIFTLPNKYAPFLSLLTTGVMPLDAVEKGDKLMPVTNGDFTIARMEHTGDVIRKLTLYTKNDKYKIKKIVFKYYANEEELTTAAKLGEINAFLSEQTHEITNFQDYKFPIQGIYYAVYFNLRDDQLDDLELRKKLEKVLPIDQLTFDRGITVQGPISRSTFTDHDLKFDKYDEKFKDSLGDLELKLTVPDTEKHVEMAERIADLWQAKLDLDISIEKVDQKEFFTKVIEPRNFQMLLYGQEVGRDPDRYSNWYSTEKDPPGLNLSGFSQVRADRALEEGRKELNNDRRAIHYNELQKSVMDNVPVIFLYHPFSNYYVSKYIQGIGEKYTFTYADRFLDFYNWANVQTN